MKRIPVTRGQFALVDDEDYERIATHNWVANYSPHTGSFYAQRSAKTIRGNRSVILMHREIVEAKRGETLDHENGDTLDNRRENIRVCTRSQNNWNSRIGVSNTSGFKGVYWHKGHRKWGASIGLNGRNKHLGYFESPTDAAKAYDDAARTVAGEFAHLNFPDGKS
jgi:hypothetical protein